MNFAFDTISIYGLSIRLWYFSIWNGTDVYLDSLVHSVELWIFAIFRFKDVQYVRSKTIQYQLKITECLPLTEQFFRKCLICIALHSSIRIDRNLESKIMTDVIKWCTNCVLCRARVLHFEDCRHWYVANEKVYKCVIKTHERSSSCLQFAQIGVKMKSYE